MTSSPEPSPRDRDVLAKRLQVVRGAAIGTILLFFVPVPPWEWLENAAPLLLVVPLSIPFLMILWRLRRIPRKEGLALAMGAGGILCVGAGLGLLIVLNDGGPLNWSALVLLAVFAPVQAILTGSAIATYKLVGYAKGDWKVLTRGVVDPLVYFGVIAFFFVASAPMLYESRARRAPGEAVAWMKKLHECAGTYAASHPAQGFPAQLELLGPQGSKCIVPLSPGSERSGYVFTYAPSTPESGGKVPGYALTTRPANRMRPGQQSFYMDATGVIRAATEDRDATAQDPVAQ
jgi:hypothetical protein